MEKQRIYRLYVDFESLETLQDFVGDLSEHNGPEMAAYEADALDEKKRARHYILRRLGDRPAQFLAG